MESHRSTNYGHGGNGGASSSGRGRYDFLRVCDDAAYRLVPHSSQMGIRGTSSPPSGGDPSPSQPRLPQAASQTGKYRPPHLRNLETGGSSVQRQGAEQTIESGVSRRPPAPPFSSRSATHHQHHYQPSSGPAKPGIESNTSPSQQPVLCPPEITSKGILPVRRPDEGTLAVRSVSLLVNHFLVHFNPRVTIMHYALDIRELTSPGSRRVKRSINKADLRLIRDKLFADDPARFPFNRTAYDGEKNLYSSVVLPTGQFKLELPGKEDLRSCVYILTIKLMNELKLSKLEDYLNGRITCIPRDILQGMDLVMKENPSRHRLCIDRNFYSTNFKIEDDLKCGVAAIRGFQHSLKPTAQGLALCLDYSVLAVRKPLPVLEFLREQIPEFDGVNDNVHLRRKVSNVLKGLTVRVNHRFSKQKYAITGLTSKSTCELFFDFIDPKGRVPPVKVSLVNYFKDKYSKNIIYRDIPCLILGRNNRINHVPMEFCVLVEGQKYRKELLDEDTACRLKKKCLARPQERKRTISEMVQAYDGPCGDVAQNFGFRVDQDMTAVVGRVIGPPNLKLGALNGNVNIVKLDNEKCQWSLAENSVVDGKPLQNWALIDFSLSHRLKLRASDFIKNLINRSKSLGISMEEPVVCRFSGMCELSSVTRLEELLRSVVHECRTKNWSRLQIIICVMAEKHPGYKYLKWLSETRIGIVTQCCLSIHANKGDEQFLANLCLKINAKLGGSNAELLERLPLFESEDHVMFIGADVNHPVSKKATTPSIAAVVATVNWPVANRYAARICPQDHRTEKILEFGTMCADLMNTYVQLNKVRPKKIIVFRDGVSEGQFDMVLNEELLDLKSAIFYGHYQPKITVIVVQKRQQTRLFLENMKDWGSTGNVPPGTVVDTKIVHPFEFDFYLCSHYGRLGTSRAMRYCVLWDENSFTSDQLQELIYDLCFTFARCTKPVSLVPPVYYADLVAYRGRIFQEVAKEFQSHTPSSASLVGLSSSSPLLPSPSISATSFGQGFYSLHPDLQNVMFFI